MAAPKGNKNHFKYGYSHTRIDNIYKAMVARCYKTTSVNYKRYGAKGVKVCDEWLKDKQKFFKWAFENGYSESLTIDRIDVNGNYEPSNCRWTTYKKQANNKSNNRLITYNGETHTLAEWGDIKGINQGTLHSRLKRGWDVERTLTTAPFN